MNNVFLQIRPLDQENVSNVLKGKANVLAPRRAALGDITTNTLVTNKPKEIAKNAFIKPATKASSKAK